MHGKLSALESTPSSASNSAENGGEEEPISEPSQEEIPPNKRGRKQFLL